MKISIHYNIKICKNIKKIKNLYVKLINTINMSQLLYKLLLYDKYLYKIKIVFNL